MGNASHSTTSISRVLCNFVDSFTMFAARSVVVTGVRTYATAASTSGLVTPPIQVFGLSGRYATALYSAAHKKNALEKVENDLRSFKSKLKTDSNLAQLCSSAPTAIKKALPQEALKIANASPVTQSFVDLLKSNNRLEKAEGMIDSYLELMAAHRGEVKGHIVSANPLNDKTVSALHKSLEQHLEKGQKLKLSTEVKSDIVGGLVITLGEKHIDLSVKTKLSNL